jgi:signal transduction histidine kinase
MAIVVLGTVLGTDDADAVRTTFRLIGGAFVACGLIAWRRRPDSRSGLLMTATGFLLFVEPLFAQFASPELNTVGDVLEDVWSVPIIWLLLTMLSGGRLTTTVEKVLVGAFVVEFALEITWHFFLERDGNFLLIDANADAAAAIDAVVGVLVSLACVATAVVIGVRFKRASGPGRRALLPSVAGISSLLFFAVVQQAAPMWIQWLAVMSLLLIPGGFLAGLLSSRLARGALAELFRDLPTMRGEELQAALARTLGDPGLVVAYGRPLPPVGEDRAALPIVHDGHELAVMLYDRSLDDDPELLDAAAAAAAIALESRTRLERIVSAGDDERRRLERNLHDGAQQRLVALAMQLSLIQHQLRDDPDAAERLVTSASAELALSLEELRELARGIHPAVLDHGLEPALEALANQSTVPTTVAYSAGGKLPEAVELAAYFVTSEALANTAKYARATTAAVRVSRENGHVMVEISDDGVGGADPSRGSGLRGLRDRVEALDGRLRVDSPFGEGTTVTAELPCGS